MSDIACCQRNHNSIDAFLKRLASVVNVSFGISQDVSCMMHSSMLMVLFVQKLKKPLLINFLMYRKRKLSKEHQFSFLEGNRSLHVSLMLNRFMSMLLKCVWLSPFCKNIKEKLAGISDGYFAALNDFMLLHFCLMAFYMYYCCLLEWFSFVCINEIDMLQNQIHLKY